MTDLQWDHNSDSFNEALGIGNKDLKKFLIDVVEDTGSKISEALEYIWEADCSIEMKICAFYVFGREYGSSMGSMEGGLFRMIKEITQDMREKLEEDED